MSGLRMVEENENKNRNTILISCIINIATAMFDFYRLSANLQYLLLIIHCVAISILWGYYDKRSSFFVLYKAIKVPLLFVLCYFAGFHEHSLELKMTMIIVIISSEIGDVIAFRAMVKNKMRL